MSAKPSLAEAIEREAAELLTELEMIKDKWPEDRHYDQQSLEPGVRGPSPIETKLGRRLMIFERLVKYKAAQTQAYIRAMGLTGRLGKEMVLAMFREIEGKPASGDAPAIPDSESADD